MDMENLIGKKKFSLGQNASTILFLLLFIALFGAILSFATPNFLTAYNVGVIFKQMSFFGVAALGQTLVLIIGGIDLSIGSTACLSGILFALCMTKTGMHPLLAVVICVIAGALMGYINGLFITKLKLHPFIVTLAASNIGYGFVLVISEGYTISGITGKVLTIGQGMLGPIPVPTVIFIVFVAILTYILKCTPFGRELFAIGGNAAASRLVGINVESRTRLVYLLSGAFAAFAGIMVASRYNSGQPTIGETWVMNSITAAVIGGTSMAGGVGTVVGTLVGTLLMQLLSNAIVMLNISQYWEQVMIGSVVLLAVVIDSLRTMGRTKSLRNK